MKIDFFKFKRIIRRIWWNLIRALLTPNRTHQPWCILLFLSFFHWQFLFLYYNILRICKLISKVIWRNIKANRNEAKKSRYLHNSSVWFIATPNYWFEFNHFLIGFTSAIHKSKLFLKNLNILPIGYENQTDFLLHCAAARPPPRKPKKNW